MMAEGGIQAADKPNDSPAHSLSGRVRRRSLRGEARAAAHAGDRGSRGHSMAERSGRGIRQGSRRHHDHHPRRRYLPEAYARRRRTTPARRSCGPLRDEVLNRGIPVVDFTAAIETHQGRQGSSAAGAVLLNMETEGNIWWRVLRPSSSPPAAQAGCTIRASPPPITTARRRTA